MCGEKQAYRQCGSSTAHLDHQVPGVDETAFLLRDVRTHIISAHERELIERDCRLLLERNGLAHLIPGGM